MSSTAASAVVRLLLPARPVTVKRANETTMDLEQIIDDLVYRKKKLDLDSPERQLIDRMRQHQQVSQKKPLKVVSRRARRNPL